MALTPEQRVQLRGMALDLAIRGGATGDTIVTKAQELFEFILKDELERQAEQQTKLQNAMQEKVIKLV